MDLRSHKSANCGQYLMWMCSDGFYGLLVIKVLAQISNGLSMCGQGYCELCIRSKKNQALAEYGKE